MLKIEAFDFDHRRFVGADLASEVQTVSFALPVDLAEDMNSVEHPAVGLACPCNVAVVMAEPVRVNRPNLTEPLSFQNHLFVETYPRDQTHSLEAGGRESSSNYYFGLTFLLR